MVQVGVAHLPITGEVRQCLHVHISRNHAAIIVIIIIIIVRGPITAVQVKAALRSRRVVEEVVSVHQVEARPVRVEVEVAVDDKVIETDE